MCNIIFMVLQMRPRTVSDAFSDKSWTRWCTSVFILVESKNRSECQTPLVIYCLQKCIDLDQVMDGRVSPPDAGDVNSHTTFIYWALLCFRWFAKRLAYICV